MLNDAREQRWTHTAVHCQSCDLAILHRPSPHLGGRLDMAGNHKLSPQQ